MQIVLAKIHYILPDIQIHPGRSGRGGLKKIMTTDEFGEIHETWTELMTIYEEIEALNAEAQPGTAFGAFAAQTSAAQ
jgi:hypothetical protein